MRLGGLVRRAERPEPKWVQESHALRQAMTAAQNGKVAADPPDDVHDGRVECPHCQRRFAPAAAERHIPKCEALKTPKRRVSPTRR